MIDPKNAVGKPFVALKDGKKASLGNISRATVKDGTLYLAITLDLSEGAPADAQD